MENEIYIHICIYIYIVNSRCAVVRYDTVLRRTRQCSNRSRRLLKFWTSKVIPHLAISLWDICTKMTAIHRGCTIYRCLRTGMKLSYTRNIIYTYTFFFIWVIAKYFSYAMNATYPCFIAPAPFDVKYMNIRNYHLNGISSRLDIEKPVSSLSRIYHASLCWNYYSVSLWQ